MTNNARFNELFESVQASSSASGRYDSMLDAETRQILDEFVNWLRTENKTEATSKSYRSYVAKALAIGGKLSSDQMSAIRAFERFVKTLDV